MNLMAEEVFSHQEKKSLLSMPENLEEIGIEEIEVGDSEDRTVDVVSIEAIILEIGHTLIWMILKDFRTKLKLKRGVRLTTEIYLVDNLYG